MDPNAEKRVALARDVIAQLDAKQIRAEIGTYYHRSSPDAPCGVCALGSLMVACCGIPKTNSVNVVEIFSCLEGTFDDDQIVLIEAAFEGIPSPITFEHRGYESDEARLTFAADALGPIETDDEGDTVNDEDRLRRIMSNIIENAGEFVPEAL